MQDAFGVERGEVSKKKEQKASDGRLLLGTVAPGWHGAIAGKKGRKIRAVANEAGGSFLGAGVGGSAGAALGAATRKPGAAIAGYTLGSHAGGYTGAFMGTKRAQRMGHFKPER